MKRNLIRHLGAVIALLALTARPAAAATTELGNVPNNTQIYTATQADAQFVPINGALGTPGSGTLTNCTGLPESSVTNLVTDLAAKVPTNGALGTPSSGTLTNCTSLPIAGLTDDTSHVLGLGGIELGHATDTSIARVSAGVISVEGNMVYTANNVPFFSGGFRTPPGLCATNITTVTAFTSTNTYAVYVGQAGKGNPTFDVIVKLTTNVGTITWAEVAIATGTPVANGNQSLTKRGFTSVSATFNSGATSTKKTTVTTSGVTIGDSCYVLLGSQATTPFQVRGMLADDLQTGVFSSATARPSTMAAPTTFTLAGATVVPPWVVVRQY